MKKAKISSGTLDIKLLDPLKLPPGEHRRLALAQMARCPYNRVIDPQAPATLELVESMKQMGWRESEPALVRPVPDLDPTKPALFEIISGERRTVAAGIAGLPDAPVVIMPLSDAEATILRLAENRQREDLTYWEEADEYAGAVARKELTAEQIGERLGVKRSSVFNLLRVARLELDVRQACQTSGATPLPASLAVELAAVPTAKLQLKVLKGWQQREWDEEKEESVTAWKSVRFCKSILEEKFRANLDKATFSLKAIFDGCPGTYQDRALDNLPCAECPARSGNLDPDSKSPNVCTDPACFARKAKYAREDALRKYTEIDIRDLGPAADKKYFQYGTDRFTDYSHEWLAHNDKPAEDPKKRTVMKIIDVAEKEGWRPATSDSACLLDPKGQALMVYRAAAVGQALTALGVKLKTPEKTARPAAHQAEMFTPLAEQARRAWATEISTETNRRLHTACLDHLASLKVDAKLAPVLRWTLTQLGQQIGDTHVLRAARGWSTWDAGLAKAKPAELPGLLFELSLSADYDYDPASCDLGPDAKALGVDAAKIAKVVKEEMSALPKSGSQVPWPAEEVEALDAKNASSAIAKRAPNVPAPFPWQGRLWLSLGKGLCQQVVEPKDWTGKTYEPTDLIPPNENLKSLKVTAGKETFVLTDYLLTFVPEKTAPAKGRKK